MRVCLSFAVLAACITAAAPQLSAQNDGAKSSSGQSQPAAGSQAAPSSQQPSRTNTQQNANPFPENTDSVPVLPNRDSPEAAPSDEEPPSERTPIPAEDADPVRAPEDAAAAATPTSSSSSSSRGDIGDLFPDDDANQQPGKHKKKGEEVVPEHHETAAEDEEVGGYYLSNKDWKAALSRFQSALVLDPDNPDVYWGLAEAERHTGDFADARANYLKVREYDPGSHHAKEAAKALEDPEIANAKADAAKPQAAGQPAVPPQQ
ncbi:MAG TPA: tetratricopeptide repeat protein [Terracidiphilus sp.]|nr:tetratricopeptide repeat protein [Terracidiphilus sp.]